jgi:hypothetical protein
LAWLDTDGEWQTRPFTETTAELGMAQL